MDGSLSRPEIKERGTRDTDLGPALQLKIWTKDHRPLTWDEVYDVFTEQYPGCWAVEVFPPRDHLVNGRPVRHLFVLKGPPRGMNIKEA